MTDLIEWEFKIGCGVALVAAAYLTVNAALHPVLSFWNRHVDSGETTVVLSNDYNSVNDEGMFPGGFDEFVMYPPIVLRNNLRGRHVVWDSNATLDQTIGAFKNPEYQNIVLIGYGSESSYLTADGVIDVGDLGYMADEIPRRRGKFAQYTCGEWRDGMSLADFLFYPSEDSVPVSYNRTVLNIESWFLSWLNVVTD